MADDFWVKRLVLIHEDIMEVVVFFVQLVHTVAFFAVFVLVDKLFYVVKGILIRVRVGDADLVPIHMVAGAVGVSITIIVVFARLFVNGVCGELYALPRFRISLSVRYASIALLAPKEFNISVKAIDNGVQVHVPNGAHIASLDRERFDALAIGADFVREVGASMGCIACAVVVYAHVPVLVAGKARLAEDRASVTVIALLSRVFPAHTKNAPSISPAQVVDAFFARARDFNTDSVIAGEIPIAMPCKTYAFTTGLPLLQCHGTLFGLVAVEAFVLVTVIPRDAPGLIAVSTLCGCCSLAGVCYKRAVGPIGARKSFTVCVACITFLCWRLLAVAYETIIIETVVATKTVITDRTFSIESLALPTGSKAETTIETEVAMALIVRAFVIGQGLAADRVVAVVVDRAEDVLVAAIALFPTGDGIALVIIIRPFLPVGAGDPSLEVSVDVYLCSCRNSHPDSTEENSLLHCYFVL